MFDHAFQRGIQRIAEERIRAAMERGEFANLSGRGEPLPDADEMPDEMWWVRKWIRREGVQPPAVHRQLNDALRDMRTRREAQRDEADDSSAA